jgi:cell division transport system permease protein
MPYALREALAAFRRTPLLTGLSAVMIAISLFVVGLFGLAAYNIKVVIDRVESRVEVVAYLRDNASWTAVQNAQAEILELPEVRDVRYVSREQALIIARDELPEFAAIFGEMDSNPLPASFEVALRPNQTGPAAVESVADRLASYPFVEEVVYGRDWLDTVYLLRRAAGVTTAVLGGAFAAVAALIIAAAIRLAIFARRDEINIMRLVGATDEFVRRPFLLEGMITGLIGGILALVLTRLAFRVLAGSVFADLAWMPPLWLAAGLLAGVVFGGAASAIAVRHHLQEV